MTLDPSNPSEGIYYDVPEAVYRGAVGINQSLLKEADLSMAHFHQAWTSPPEPPTPDQIIGTLTHALILQKRQLFAVIPEDAPKKPTKAQLSAKKPSDDTLKAIGWWDSFKSLNPGKEYLSKDEAATIYAMRDAVMAHPIASEMIARASGFEVAAFRKHSSGLMMKGLADCVCTDDMGQITIPDIKTCRRGGASLSEFERSIYTYGYHRQGAYYIDLFKAAYFVFIAVEKEKPHAVACYSLREDARRLGQLLNDSALNEIARCQEQSSWPAYHEGIKEIGIPAWAINKDAAKLPQISFTEQRQIGEGL